MVATEERPSLRIKSYAQLVNTYMKERERKKERQRDLEEDKQRETNKQKRK